jgi:molybdopterin-biosynthesis enzyme MoeA-like protein
MLRDFYAALYAAGHVDTPYVTPARRKMATLPAGARPLLNTVGAAPGIFLTVGETIVASMPGVPTEMKAIFAESLWPRLAAGFSSQAFLERTIPTDNRDESAMSPAVNAVAARHPNVYIKSRAQVYGSGLANFITLSARAADLAAAALLLDAAESDLRNALTGAGVTTGPAEAAS